MRTLALAAALVALATLPATADAQHQGHGTPPAAAPAHKEHGAGATREHTSGWSELDAYHMVMMGVWHPAKESGDLKPIRAQAVRLAQSGDILAKAEVPPACSSDATRGNVTRIRDESHALAGLVAKGTDAEVMGALRALHDRFELVNRSCIVVKK